jgi:hypothetical protein
MFEHTSQSMRDLVCWLRKAAWFSGYFKVSTPGGTCFFNSRNISIAFIPASVFTSGFRSLSKYKTPYWMKWFIHS